MLEFNNDIVGLSPPQHDMPDSRVSFQSVDPSALQPATHRFLQTPPSHFRSYPLAVPIYQPLVVEPKDKPLQLDVVERDDSRYRLVCELVRQVYSNEVKVVLDDKYFSPIMVTAFDQGVPVGAIGMTRGGTEELLTEILCRDKLKLQLADNRVTDMHEVAEFGCMSVVEEYRNKIILPLVKAVLNYAYRTGTSYGVMTFGAHVRRHLRDRISGKYMPMSLIEDKPVAPQEVADLWAVRYSHTRPACYGTVMREAVNFWDTVEMAPFETTSKLAASPAVKRANA